MESAKIVADRLRGGTVGLDVLAQAGWNCQGFAMKMALGSGVPAFGAADEQPKAMSRDELADHLEDCCDDPTHPPKPKKAFPWALILQALLQILPQLLKETA
jgi:hypothetical protein